MQQHPVPQSITTYKFRLVGDMTLKQFLELAFGLVFAWLIFASKLSFFIKWAFGPLFGFLGFALAFVPIEDRPLDQWIINFFKAIYSPSQFVFKSEVKALDIFAPTQALPPETNHFSSANPAELEEYLTSLPASPSTAFEIAEQKYLDHINNLFGALGINHPQSTTLSNHPQPANPYKSSLKGVRVRKLFTPQLCLLPHATLFQTPPEPKQAVMPASPKLREGGPIVVKAAPIVAVKPQPRADRSLAEKPALVVKPKPTIVKPALAPRNFSAVGPTFASDIVLPHTSDKPNLISGITLNKAGKIISGVIIEIRDKQNLPVRALRSNKLGQFFIATPLSDGIYQIQAEHPNEKFAIIKVEVKSEIIPPLKIQAIT